jgi:hypothetical protein
MVNYFDCFLNGIYDCTELFACVYVCIILYYILICILLEKHENTLTRKHTHTVYTHIHVWIHTFTRIITHPFTIHRTFAFISAGMQKDRMRTLISTRQNGQKIPQVNLWLDRAGGKPKKHVQGLASGGSQAEAKHRWMPSRQTKRTNYRPIISSLALGQSIYSNPYMPVASCNLDLWADLCCLN